ncbi:MAG: DUF4190 domain-containing protein [Microbacterium sp.]|uniref:DUF4190 domain-containing protein n=1 Tax=Microbacterium sp. TaxID=51671 RepID=UPI0039E46DE1
MTEPTSGVRTNTLALIGFIAAFIVPLLGLILGIVAVNQLRGRAVNQGGRGFARWAVVIGGLGTCAQAAFFIVWLTLLIKALQHMT